MCIHIYNNFISDLCKETFTAGRSDDCNLTFLNSDLTEKILCRISKYHFRLERDINDLTSPVYIYDLARNGTFVNEVRIGYNKKRILSNDDNISLVHPQYKGISKFKIDLFFRFISNYRNLF